VRLAGARRGCTGNALAALARVRQQGKQPATNVDILLRVVLLGVAIPLAQLCANLRVSWSCERVDAARHLVRVERRR